MPRANREAATLSGLRCGRLPTAAGLAAILLAVQAVAASAAKGQPRHAAGEILVRYAAGVGENEIAEIHAWHGTRVLESIPELGLHRLAIPDDRPVDAMIEACRGDPRFQQVEANYLGEGGDFVPNDRSFHLQWHLDNRGRFGGAPGADIDAVEGWQISRGDESVVVAVLDTGIDFDHPQFAGRLLPGFDFVNEDADPDADHHHGVWVSGVLAANADDRLSVAGVDHFARVLPIKVLDEQNLGSVMDLAQGLVFAANAGASVINMSLIDYPTGGFLEDALRFARDAGSVLVACAGNGGIGDADRSGPGASPLTISVGATTPSDERAGFSGTGSALDVVAPGVFVFTVHRRTAAPTWFSGCSAATPIVSGIASLLLSLDPFATHDQIRAILAETADDRVGPASEDAPGRDNFFGHGRVNLSQALAWLVMDLR